MRSLLRPWMTGVLLFLLCAAPEGDAAGEPTPGEPSGGGVAVEGMVISGSWQGAKLRCRKEEGKAVRCGKPEPFDVTFNDDGTGTSADDRFPNSFTYTWTSPTEILITPRPEGEELKLFQLEKEEGFLTFQAYVYLPRKDTDLPEEVNYVHYIFDVSKTE